MKYRNPYAVFFLPFITFGIYAIYWIVETKIEMNRNGADIPTAWCIIVPLVNIWWLWKFCGGLEKITKGKVSQIVGFILLWQLNLIGMVITQDSINHAHK